MAATDSEGPAWNKFWMSLDAETESVMSGDDTRSHSRLPPPMTPDTRSHLMSPDPSRQPLPHLERGDSVLPNDSASHHGLESPTQSATGHGAKFSRNTWNPPPSPSSSVPRPAACIVSKSPPLQASLASWPLSSRSSDPRQTA